MSPRLTSNVVSWSPSRQHFTLSPKQPSGLNEVEMKNLILEFFFLRQILIPYVINRYLVKNSILVLILQGQSLVRRTIFIYQTNKKGEIYLMHLSVKCAFVLDRDHFRFKLGYFTMIIENIFKCDS